MRHPPRSVLSAVAGAVTEPAAMAQRATPACAVEYSGSGSDAVPTAFQPNGTPNGATRRVLGVDRRLRPVQRAPLGPRDVHVRDDLSQ